MGVPEVPASLRSWMSAVNEIVRSVNAAEPLEKVLTRVAVLACELIGFEFCAVMRQFLGRCTWRDAQPGGSIEGGRAAEHALGAGTPAVPKGAAIPGRSP